jgi:hypothetical protein
MWSWELQRTTIYQVRIPWGPASARCSGLSPVEELRMPSDERIKTLADGRRVKFTYQELPDEGAFITA